MPHCPAPFAELWVRIFLGITQLFYRKMYWGYYSLLPLYLWNCGVRIFWDNKVNYWQRGGGSYALLPCTICGAPGPHFLDITKFIHGY